MSYKFRVKGNLRIEIWLVELKRFTAKYSVLIVYYIETKSDPTMPCGVPVR